MAIDSTYIETYVNLGGNYLRIKDYEKARDILTKGLKFATNKNLRTKSILLINLAIAYNNLGDYENGLKYSNEALEISENDEIIKFAEKINLDCEEKLDNKNSH